MKTVQDKDGNKIEVKDDTPCQAGINGALPIMLDKTLDADIFAEMAEREAKAKAKKVKWDADSTPRNAMVKMSQLENKITPRRLREAILSTDGKIWLIEQDALIEAERAKLNGS